MFLGIKDDVPSFEGRQANFSKGDQGKRIILFTIIVVSFYVLYFT